MEYQNKLSKLRHAFLRLQGQDLTQVLLRAAAKEAEGIAKNVYTTEEIFRAITDKIYEGTNELSWNAKFELVSDAESLAILKKELIEDTIEEFEWEETLFDLLDGLEDSERSIVKAVLNNQRMYMQMEQSAGTSTHSLAGFNNLLIPIVRRIFKNFEIGKLVGVQPMTGPVGLVYLLRYRQRNADGEHEDIIDEETGGKKISLDIVSKAIEASSRRLAACWSIEAIQDCKSIHGIDLEAEMSQAIAAEIQDEITAEIMGNLHTLAGDTKDVELDGLEASTPTKLTMLINEAANDIAKKTHRGAGNWVVVPTTTVAMFESLPASVYERKEVDRSNLTGSLLEVGTLNGTIKVFSSLTIASDEMLVGYKGGNGGADTGYVYAPYVPVMSSGVVVNPKTFQPVISLMSRAGKAVNGDVKYDEEGNKLDVPPKAQNYYNLIKIKGNLFTEIESSGEDS